VKPLQSSALPPTAGPLRGAVRLPGDKSISHRSLLLGAIAVGETVVDGLLEGEDVLRTAAALRALGAEILREDDGRWRIHGVGVGGLAEPGDVLDMGNSGTAARLLMGLVASHPFTSFFTGDASLRRRPMARVAGPLEAMGARILARDGGRLPLAVVGTAFPLPITYRLPVPSAQVKSAILFAGLNAPGRTIVIEPVATRDHTERMLRHFGADVIVEPHGEAGRKITLTGQPELRAAPVVVPGDPSSAAFPIVAGLITPRSDIVVEGVMMNPLRTGLITTLLEMGADIEPMNRRVEGGEEVADLRVRAGALRGVEVPASRAPSMIDEYPVLAVAAAFALGPTRMRGLHELRVKESDRLAAVAAGLAGTGVRHFVEGDDLMVEGGSGEARGGGTVATHLDHRIAMSFLVMGLASHEAITVDDGTMIATSFPTFVEMMRAFGGRIE